MDNLRYEMFLAEQSREQAKLELYINECVLLSNKTNTIDNITVLNENFSDKVKESFKKILSSIGAMWKKFLEAMNTLIKADEKYLEQYKDIILNKKPVDASYTMYDYSNKTKGGISLLYNTPLPSLSIDNIPSANSKDDYIANTREFSIFTQGVKAPYDLAELAKTKYRGGSQQVILKSNQLNMTDMFNYCKDYSKVKDLLSKDLTTIQRVADDVIKAINNLDEEGVNKATGGTTPQQESFNINDLFSKPKYYSYVYESYITEEENQPNNGGSQPSGNNGGSQPASGGSQPSQQPNNGGNQPNNGNGNQNGNGGSQPNGGNNGQQPANGERVPDPNAEKDKAKNEELEKKKQAMIDVAGYYLSSCGNILGAKQTVAQEIYKAYMSIIKAHVRDYNNANGKVDDKPQDTATQNKGYNQYTNNSGGESAGDMMGLNN